jgi:hypothetical protein
MYKKTKKNKTNIETVTLSHYLVMPKKIKITTGVAPHSNFQFELTTSK